MAMALLGVRRRSATARKSDLATSGSNFIPRAMCWARPRSPSAARISASSPPATTRMRAIRRVRHSSWFPATSSSLRRRSGCRCFGMAMRVIALLREVGYDAPIYLHGAMEKITQYYQSRGVKLGELREVRGVKKTDLAGTITLAPPTATSDIWTRRFPDPVTAFASGWMRVRARARQRGIELPLVISDHADWDGLTATIAATGAGEVWVTHGQEDALVHWCGTRGLKARPLAIVGYGDEDDADGPANGGAT